MERCYICRKELREKHDSYHRLCKECGESNLMERKRKGNLSNYIILVTGGRIKIGYYTALKLLRAGARVIVTTRFPLNALSTYSKEKDFEKWKENLIIYEIDLKKVGEIEAFIQYIQINFPKLDIIVNNAAQTIKKSKKYYAELEEAEEKLSSIYLSECKYPQLRCINTLNNQICKSKSKDIINLEETEDYNSWVAKPEDISLYEFLEVQIINSTAPFMLCTRLKESLKKSDNMNKFIINVSSVEGMFSEKRKSSKHIHTNMAKASLNMLTKSLSKDYAKYRIFIYSVDPGWVSNQFPKNWNGVCDEKFNAPLTYEDAAARICNPIFKYLNSEKLDEFGVLLKDYKKQEW
ncbi:NAD(P)-dependent dehydrogenase (short-subunit alcohol dehydrogenase family) [Clostridium tetanomorphum]|uniref:SDR family oxidoreductase n=1 Tax=Clostridium tetanomorphum TaxID=1553 RepID=A0A923E8Y2_CLOTT|nr:SDR family oxidoreductase [Clostridium tetanomorphum]KAJ51924.1 oxidoreductase [Clostridium tetanomorphum DSM 665]MBC2398653.1 SDR family oxidoreductase [Clostridium tetanomorphum]MBP1864068.1 NAD(P)-dependent dehydrogenase (short-subunit alcohol dehydrogenase family) [Clostridium tetanomorphum]NRS84481.1 NAD(P)-dependent dehydrogenase (short-subunit alcohol dehydrogenase family) [Clostridium tetanomorphum]NRZ97695.1 NAD(P)-dependent dehydrogenase (short-subunit alcohol dehydrogenase family